MDIFDILKAILKRKVEIMHKGISDKDALIKAEIEISKEYHIPMPDIKRINRAQNRQMSKKDKKQVKINRRRK